MEKDEILAVALLGLGVLAIANPALLGVQNVQGDLQVSAQQTNIDDFTFAQVTEGMPGIIYVPGMQATLPSQLSDQDRAILQSATDQGYQLQGTTQSEIEGYLRRTGFVIVGDRLLRPGIDQQNGLLLYQEVEDSVVVDVENRTDPEAAALSQAVDGNETRLSENASTLLAYDYVRDGDTFYRLSFETRGEELYLSVDEQTREDVLMSLDPVGDIEEVPAEVRDEVRSAIEGENATVSMDSRAALQEIALIRYEGGFYQIQAQQTEPPITDLLQPYNYALMVAGLLLIAASGLYARKVYAREKDSGGEVRHVVTTADDEESEGDGSDDDEDEDDASDGDGGDRTSGEEEPEDGSAG